MLGRLGSTSYRSQLGLSLGHEPINLLGERLPESAMHRSRPNFASQRSDTIGHDRKYGPQAMRQTFKGDAVAQNYHFPRRSRDDAMVRRMCADG
jgi:hypothetical protein